MHHHQVLAQLVFMSNYLDSGPLRNALIRFYLVEHVWCDGEVEPTDVKFIGLLGGLLEVEGGTA